MNMSRVGKLPIKLPDGVSVNLSGNQIDVKGPNGQLSKKVPESLEIVEKNGELLVLPKRKDIQTRAMHGTYRAHLANMVKGVKEGWEKTLELVGTGYRAEVSGKNLIVTVGYSHPVEIEAPEGISFDVQKTLIKVRGVDKELVGQISATIRDIRKPEPYKGKGIKYEDEVVRRKPGKAAKAQGAAA